MAYTGDKKREYDRAYRLKNKEKLAEYNANWRNENLSKEKISLDNKLYREKNKERLKEYRKQLARNPQQRYSLGKNRSKYSKKEFSITFEEWQQETSKPCYYCSDILKNPNENAGFGLDRIDSNEGYTITNVVSCCGFCNCIKFNMLSREETKTVIELIIKMRGLEQVKNDNRFI
jgi:hypothetical protein